MVDVLIYFLIVEVDYIGCHVLIKPCLDVLERRILHPVMALED